MIAIEGLSFRFRGSPHAALQDVNLTVEQGEFLVVTGPSGCGKSTLALAIGGYLSRRGQYEGEASGSVRVHGIDAREQPIYELAEVLGLVQQNPEAQFCTLTVQDEVAFGLENRCLPAAEIWERMRWALDIVGARHLEGRQLATLSGGERQKVAIAAMMATRPKVIIFDEPTSNLDPEATAEVFQVIAQIRATAGITVIVIEHKVDYLLPFEPRLVTMDAGRIVYDGLYDELRCPRIRTEAARAVPSPEGTRGGEPPSVVYPGEIEARQALGSEPVVCLDDVSLGYEDQPVLQGLTLQVWPGEFVAVMGDNGSGKTTFLQSLLGLRKPSRGRVQVLGQDTCSGQTSVSRLARQVGLVFQNPDHQIFADSVWEEATFAPRNFRALDQVTRARIDGLLVRCGLGGRYDDHPYRLSFGQKRRLNLVSVLAYAPRLILLDEVLIGQDAANAVFLLNLLRERTEQGDAVIMVNHAPEVTWLYATRLIFFERGRLLVDAPTEDGFRELAALGRSAYLPPGWAHSGGPLDLPCDTGALGAAHAGAGGKLPRPEVHAPPSLRPNESPVGATLCGRPASLYGHPAGMGQP